MCPSPKTTNLTAGKPSPRESSFLAIEAFLRYICIPWGKLPKAFRESLGKAWGKLPKRGKLGQSGEAREGRARLITLRSRTDFAALWLKGSSRNQTRAA